MKERSLLLTLLIAFGIVAGIFVTWDFARHWVSNLQLNSDSARLDQEIAKATEENQKLVALKGEVQTDAWIEKYVRTYWHWTKQNEQIVVPRATPIAVPTPVPAPAAVPQPSRQFWEDWLDAIFGTPQ